MTNAQIREQARQLREGVLQRYNDGVPSQTIDEYVLTAMTEAADAARLEEALLLLTPGGFPILSSEWNRKHIAELEAKVKEMKKEPA